MKQINNTMHLLNVQGLQHSIYAKYSSSQTYFYCKTINNIIKQKLTSSAAYFEDLQYYLDEDQYLKRCYSSTQFKIRMNTFKQYYFYHQDCPRIFIHNIELIYAKWQDRKRNLVYKNLKHLFNNEKSAESITDTDQQEIGPSHFLYELSEYNPFSKKYYLRVQEKKHKTNKRISSKQSQRESKDQISYLKHDLSDMLKDMNELSMISTLDSKRIESKSKIYHRKNIIPNEICNDFSNFNSCVKINFKKKYQENGSTHATTNIEKQISGHQFEKYQLSTEGNEIINFRSNTNPKKLQSPNKYLQIPNKQGSIQKLKSKSIFAVRYTTLGKLGEQPNRLKLNTKRQSYKLNIEVKLKKQATAKTLKSKQKPNKNYQSEQKKKISLIKCNSIGKMNSVHKTGNIQLRSRQNSLNKFKTKPDQFQDKKLQLLAKNNAIKLPSYKSQHSEHKKAVLKIRPAQTYLSKGKKLQIKI